MELSFHAPSLFLAVCTCACRQYTVVNVNWCRVLLRGITRIVLCGFQSPSHFHALLHTAEKNPFVVPSVWVALFIWQSGLASKFCGAVQHCSTLNAIAVFFPCFHFSLPLTSPLLKYVLFSSTCISGMTCIKTGHRNNFITNSCTHCIQGVAGGMDKTSGECSLC